MAIRVLHIFAPGYTRRFSGDILRWKGNFERWDDPSVIHLVLDYEQGKPVDAKQAFDFTYTGNQRSTTRLERTLWIFSLLTGIMKYRREYDILHFHALWWGGLISASICKWMDIPTLYESVLLDGDTPGGIIHQQLGAVKVRMLKDFKAILTLSDFLTEDYLKFGFSKDRVFNLASSVDTELFRPVESIAEKESLRGDLDLPPDSKIILFVGSIIERKGVDSLVRAFIEIAAEQPDLFLLLVGPRDCDENPSIDEAYVEAQVRLIQQNGLSDRVRLTGAVQDRQIMAGLYRAADIFAFPSRREGLPNVLLEAMASGLPVIVSKLPVLETIIEHQVNGVFVPVDDEFKLKEEILHISRDPSLAKRISRTARQYICNKHSFYSWQSQYSGLYFDISFNHFE